MSGRKEKRALRGASGRRCYRQRGHGLEHGATEPGCRGIDRKKFKDRQLSERVGKADGFVLGRSEQ